MKIMYILSGTNMGGATLSFLTLLEKVVERSCNAIVVIPDQGTEFVNKLNELGVRHYAFAYEFDEWPKSFGVKRLLGYPYVVLREQLKQIKARKKLCDIVRAELPDIIHTNVSPLDIGYYAAKKYQIPHIWHIREYCDKDFGISLFPTKRAYRRKLKDCYTISITKELQGYNGLAGSDNSFVIYNGVRAADDCIYNPEKQNFFLSASRVSEEKGIERTIRVFAKFYKNHPLYKLIVLGEGYDYYVDHCKALAEELGVENSVVFEGFKTDVDSYMRVALALLVASPSEGFGRMTAEATFNGCIVVGYNAAGTKEILESTGGYLWNNDDEYYNALESVASLNDVEYRSAVSKAQRVARRLYSKESYTGRIFEVYDKVMGTI